MNTFLKSLRQSRQAWSLASRLLIAASIASAAIFGYQRIAHSAEHATAIPAATLDETAGPSHTETAVLAGGCFWGMQGVFEHVKGVTQVTSGYSGGTASTAHYEIVSTGTTGHAESIKIDYDPTQITYGQLLRIYFSVAHDPTELDRQGPDEGTQYRSAIFPTTEQQRTIAGAYLAQLDKAHVFTKPIVTRIETYRAFYPAETYHQNFLELHPDYPYIAFNDLPLVDELKHTFPTLYRSQAVLWHPDAAPAKAL